MKPGDIVLVQFPQADLATSNLRPALVVALAPGSHPDVLLAMVTSRLYQGVPNFDEIIAKEESDFAGTGLRVSSMIRLARLLTTGTSVPTARLGSISDERLRRIRSRLARWLSE